MVSQYFHDAFSYFKSKNYDVDSSEYQQIGKWTTRAGRQGLDDKGWTTRL